MPERVIRVEYQIEGGAADIYLTNRRVVIEVKKEGRLKNGPKAAGTSKPGESAFEQLDRYVRDERRREQRHLDDDVELDAPWVGAVTDGRRWWIWEWRARHGDVHDDAMPNLFWEGRELGSDNIGNLASILNRKPVGKEWAAGDMSAEFVGVREDLMNLYEKRKDLRATKTQKGLWLEQLRGSGNAPEKDADEMFVIHTMLILAARMISYAGTDREDEKVREGFVQWVSPSEVPGLREVIERYDWHRHSGDVLRFLYHHYIREEHRKIYGEYYTPDWLAEKICIDVIDDDFITRQIIAYNSKKKMLWVLDPACGSGTFLYHAARRIAESEPVKNAGMEDHEITEFVCGMVRGIDIHPVAVEMAKANLHRLFPRVPDSSVGVYQGDSLLTPRPEASFFSLGGENLPLRSPKGSHLIIPRWFVSSARDVAAFVKTARDDRDLPEGLGSYLTGYDEAALSEAHEQLRKIIREEDNGVWKWYILNQAGPLNMMRGVGRIVSNPPWVRYNKIQVESRKVEIREMAEERKLWTGGNVSTSFDIAALFVDRCMALYMNGERRAGWVIPHGSMEGRGWEKFREKLGGEISCTWNLKRLPFPNTPTSAIFFGVAMPKRVLSKKPGTRINRNDSWKVASEKTEWENPPRMFPAMISEWMDERKKPTARNGATIFPHCLTWVKEIRKEVGSKVRVTTRKSMHLPWSSLGELSGTVPDRWIVECLSTDDLMPHLLPTTTKCVIPIAGDEWDPGRVKNEFWKNASDLYEANRGRGANTPQTLEKQLNFSNKLFKQFGRVGEYVVYNVAGDILYAARITNVKQRVAWTLFSVPCATRNEVLYLTSILNADSMLPVFKSARQSDRHFSAHIWRKIPIPRYDGNNPTHRKLASLGKKAEEVARNTYNPDLSVQRMRNNIRQRLRESGVASEIDDACRKLMPEHAS